MRARDGLLKAKSHGYGTWEVKCPECGTLRQLRAHKYLDGRIRGEETRCQPCRGLALRRRVQIQCPECGRMRWLTQSDAAERLSQRCKKCKLVGVGKRLTAGRRMTSRGYIMLSGMKGHPLANASQQLLEHWKVMYDQYPERTMILKGQGFTIHHVNGIRSDNRVENLEFRAPGKHPNGWTLEDMARVLRVAGYEVREIA